MARSPRILLALFGLLLFASICQAETRFEAGDGQLAIRVDETTEWKVLYPSDVIPARCRLKTSPLGAVRIKCEDRDLYLGADSEANLDLDARQISVERGRTRLVSHATAKEDWRCVSGDTIVVCPAGSEFALVVTDKQPELNLLLGKARVQRGKNEPRDFTAPDPKGDGIEKWLQQTRSTTELRPAQGLGQLVTRDAQSDSPVRLDVQQYHVNVVLKPPVALVQIDQSFFNPYGTQEEGTFVFNLPSGASVSRFAMYVTPESLIEGELIERKRADEVYTTIVRSKRDPAILEQIGDNLFRMRVFPIFARDTKRILLDYTVPLVAEEGRYRFQLPLMSDRKPIQNFSLSGTIHPPFAPDSVASPSHPAIRFTGGKNQTVTFQSRQNEVKPPPYFALSYSAPANPEATVRTYQEPSDKDRFFVVTIPESKRPVMALPEKPCDLLLLIETSGNAQLPKARRLARTVIAGMGPDDRLQIGCVDVNYRSLTTDWCRANSPEASQAMQRLQEQFALGMNDLATTLPQARAVFAEGPADRRQLIVYVGDGPSRQVPNFIDQKVEPVQGPAGPPLFAIATTSDDFLQAETIQSGGRLFDLSGAHAGHSFFQWSLSHFPLPTIVKSVKIAGVENDDLFHGQIWPNGGELHITGKSPPQDVLQITLMTGAEEWTFNVDCRKHSDDVFTGRLWARRKVDSLMRNSETAVAERDRTVVQLCQEWSLMSPLTAFLVLETEQDYVRWKIDRKVRRRYWKPAGSEIARVNVNPPIAANQYSPADKLNDGMAQRIVKEIERKLANDQPDQAKQLLRRLEGTWRMKHADTVRELRRRIDAKLQTSGRLAELRIWRPLVDRRVAELFDAPVPLLTQFSYGGVTPDFLKRHPHALRMLRKVDDLVGSLNIDEFAVLIRELTGLPVVVDHQALQDEGIRDLSLDLEHLGGLSVRAFLKEVLEEHRLKCVPERHLLRITAADSRNDKMFSYVYPVDDLLPGGPLPSPHRLANPYFDAEELVRKQIESKLKKVISVQVKKTALGEVLKQISKEIDLHVRIDRHNLQEEGLNQNVLDEYEVTVDLPNLPADVALEVILEQQGLTTIIANECLKIVSRTKSDEILEARSYSVIGLEDRPENADVDAPQRWAQSMGMGGFGGGMGGGSFGGAAGGGSFGGSMGGGMGGTVANPAPPANNSSLMESFDISPASADSIDAPEPPDEDDFQLHSYPTSLYSISGVENSLRQTTSGKWMDIDQEGGAMDYVPSAHSLMIRQTRKVHSEIADVLDQQRQQISPRQALNRRRETRMSTNTETLRQVLQNCTGARWMVIDLEGGSITDSAGNSLTILHMPSVHEEIDRILTQLRRCRIVAETASSRTSWDGIDDLSAIDAPAVTPFPRNSVMIRSEKRDDEMRWLANRKVSGEINQRWRSTAKAARRLTEFQLRKHDSRLELTLPDRILRSDGPNAIVVHRGLALGEINDWAEAARSQVDFALPWLPHRSNDELATLFDISRVSEDANQITLRLGFPGFTDSYLEVTVSKPSGQPSKWIAVVANQTQFELRFEPRQVVAIDAQGAELERWELLADDAPQPIPALHEGWQAITLVTIDDANSPYTQARQALRQADTDKARKLLTDALKEQPQQPLLHFLLAWVEEFSGQKDPASLQVRNSALETVVASSAVDLVRMITLANFPALGETRIFEILQSIPDDRRTAEALFTLAEQARDLGRLEEATSFVEKSLALEKRSTERTQCQILQIELLLRRQQLQRAAEIEKTLTDLTDEQLLDLARLFADAKAFDVTDRCYDQLRQRTKLTGLALARQFELQAELYPPGKRRWELLATAQTSVPKSERRIRHFIDYIIAEAVNPEDAPIINGLAAAQKNEKIRIELKLLEARLEEDAKRASDIIYELEMAHGIPSDQFFWALQKLENGNRPADVVSVVETRIKRGEQLEPGVALILREAYSSLGRDDDAQRAGTHQFRNLSPPTPVRNDPPRNPAGGGGGGGGFFSVK